MIIPFEIFITYISWGNDGKNRPVLALMLEGDSVFIYPVTTQYKNKSEAVKKRYFKMNDWHQAGLARQSYINTSTLIKIPLSAIENKKPIGRLSIEDKQRFLEFLLK